MKPKRTSFIQFRSCSQQSDQIPEQKVQFLQPQQPAAKKSQQKKQELGSSRIRVYEESRAIVRQSIHVSDLIPELSNQEMLFHVCYFGKYGKVLKAYVQSHYDQKRQKNNLTAFITYSCQLQAALALVVFTCLFRPCKGSTKCSTNAIAMPPLPDSVASIYIKGNHCENGSCVYLHDVDADQLVSKKGKKEKLQSCIVEAKKTIAVNLDYFVQKEYQEYLQKKKPAYHTRLIRYKRFQGRPIPSKIIEFPSISQTFNMLIKEDIISQEKYIQAKKGFKNKIKKELQPSSPADPLSQQPKLEVQGISTKAVSRFDSYPYILKRYLNPQRAKQNLSPMNRLKEDYCKQRQKELQEKKYYRKKISLSPSKDKLTSKEVTNLIYQKILQTYNDEPLGKSRLEFARSESNVETKIIGYLRYVLLTKQ